VLVLVWHESVHLISLLRDGKRTVNIHTFSFGILQILSTAQIILFQSLLFPIFFFLRKLLLSPNNFRNKDFLSAARLITEAKRFFTIILFKILVSWLIKLFSWTFSLICFYCMLYLCLSTTNGICYFSSYLVSQRPIILSFDSCFHLLLLLFTFLYNENRFWWFGIIFFFRAAILSSICFWSDISMSITYLINVYMKVKNDIM